MPLDMIVSVESPDLSVPAQVDPPSPEPPELLPPELLAPELLLPEFRPPELPLPELPPLELVETDEPELPPLELMEPDEPPPELDPAALASEPESPKPVPADWPHAATQSGTTPKVTHRPTEVRGSFALIAHLRTSSRLHPSLASSAVRE
jgi:hypothetical protein